MSVSGSFINANLFILSSKLILVVTLQLAAWGLPDLVLQRYAEKGITAMFEWQAECLCTDNILSKSTQDPAKFIEINTNCH